jgi:hypothetical protein
MSVETNAATKRLRRYLFFINEFYKKGMQPQQLLLAQPMASMKDFKQSQFM